MSITTLAAPPSREPTAVAHPIRKAKKNWRGWLFVWPFAVVFLFAFMAPLLYAVWLSLFQNRLKNEAVD